MKKLALMICCTMTAITTLTLAGGLDPEIEKGDTRAFVIEMLGEPEGTLGSGSYEMLSFGRGTVELVNGKVTATDLVSEQEAVKRRAARVKAEEAQRKEAAAKAQEQASRTRQAVKQKPATAASQAKASEGKFTPEQQAELDKRIAEGIHEPPYTMSKRKLRRYRRGRSPSEIEQREQQITDAFKAELAAKQKR